MKKYFTWGFVSLFLLGGIFFFQQAKLNDGKLHVVFCNVGQGDAVFIRTPNGSDILIDGGPDDSVLSCISGHMPFWDRKIEIVVLTHPHADHLSGLISVIKRYSMGYYVTESSKNNTPEYKALQSLLVDKKITARYFRSGDLIETKDKIKFFTLWPCQEGSNCAQSKDLNNESLVELLTYGNFRVLFTGDAGAEIEDRIAGNVGKIDVLKVPHHGSKTGIGKTTLDILKPVVAVISVGKKNRYKLPSPQALNLIKSEGIKMLRTDENGEVEIVSDGRVWSIVGRK